MKETQHVKEKGDKLQDKQDLIKSEAEELNGKISHSSLKMNAHKQKDLQLVTQGKNKLVQILSVNESRKLENIPEEVKGEEEEDYSKFEELDWSF